MLPQKTSTKSDVSEQEILNYIPQARFVETGRLPGQVPSLDFGHFWYEYFDIQVWHDVINNFMTGYHGFALIN